LNKNAFISFAGGERVFDSVVVRSWLDDFVCVLSALRDFVCVPSALRDFVCVLYVSRNPVCVRSAMQRKKGKGPAKILAGPSPRSSLIAQIEGRYE
jgi:hypothetical protein